MRKISPRIDPNFVDPTIFKNWVAKYPKLHFGVDPYMLTIVGPRQEFTRWYQDERIVAIPPWTKFADGPYYMSDLSTVFEFI